MTSPCFWIPFSPDPQDARPRVASVDANFALKRPGSFNALVPLAWRNAFSPRSFGQPARPWVIVPILWNGREHLEAESSVQCGTRPLGTARSGHRANGSHAASARGRSSGASASRPKVEVPRVRHPEDSGRPGCREDSQRVGQVERHHQSIRFGAARQGSAAAQASR